MAEWTVAHPGCQLTKTCVQEKIKEVASYQDSVSAWVIRPKALQAAWDMEGAM